MGMHVETESGYVYDSDGKTYRASWGTNEVTGAVAQTPVWWEEWLESEVGQPPDGKLDRWEAFVAARRESSPCDQRRLRYRPTGLFGMTKDP